MFECNFLLKVVILLESIYIHAVFIIFFCFIHFLTLKSFLEQFMLKVTISVGG